MFLLFPITYEILNAVDSLLNKSLWLWVIWGNIYETYFSRPQHSKSGNDVINKLKPIIALILSNLKYENTCILIPFATTRTSLDTDGNITWNLEKWSTAWHI